MKKLLCALICLILVIPSALAETSPEKLTEDNPLYYTSVGTILLGQSGASTLALSSSLSLTDAYIRPEEMTGPCYVVMFYGGLYAYLVTFCPTANETMIARAQFIPSRAADELNIPVE